jgi:archaellum biogenesis protein FlaJ (TadC family)
MNKKVLLAVLGLSASAGRVEAANFAVITSPPTLLNILILVIAVAGALGAAKVLSLVRGGQLSRSWQYFVAAFVILGLCQLAVLGKAFEVINMPAIIVPAGFAVMTGLFLLGIIETKRALC